MVEPIAVKSVRELVTRITPALVMKEMAAEIELDFCRWRALERPSHNIQHEYDEILEWSPTVGDTIFRSSEHVGYRSNSNATWRLTAENFGVLGEQAGSGCGLALLDVLLAIALRTAATSALAALYMARPSCHVMALIGNGAQSEFQAIAFHQMLGIRELRLYDIDPEATSKLERNLTSLHLHNLDVLRCGSIQDAVHGADIVTTATAERCNASILTPDMILPGMHLNAIGGDRPGKTELDPRILLRPDARVVVEHKPLSRINGEVQRLEPDFPVIEIGDVLLGRIRGRANAEEITIFDSVGFALEDFAIRRYLSQMLLWQPVRGEVLDLVLCLPNPKDLYSLLLPHVNSHGSHGHR